MYPSLNLNDSNLVQPEILRASQSCSDLWFNFAGTALELTIGAPDIGANGLLCLTNLFRIPPYFEYCC